MGISPFLDDISFWNSWDIGSLVFTLFGWAYILTFEFLWAGLNFETFHFVTFSFMSVILLLCYFLTEIRQIWGYLHFWMIYLSEFFLRHFLDIGSLVFILLGWTYILTFKFLCAGLNFETSDLVTFWLVGVSFWDLLVLFG